MTYQFHKTACNKNTRLSKSTFLALLPDQSREFFNKLNTISSEYVQMEPINSINTMGQVLNTPVISGTLIGTIYVNNTPIQSFRATSTGHFLITNIVDVGYNVISGILIKSTGDIVLTWDSLPPLSYLITTYHYDNPNWYISSFNEITREVCVTVNSGNTIKTISITLQDLRSSPV